MKNLFNNLSLALLILITPLHAQTEDKSGFINVVNLIPGDGKCTVLIDSHDLAPGGMKAGNDSGWFSMDKRNVAIEIEAPGFEKASGNIDLTPGTSQVVAIFVLPNPNKGTEEKPALPLIKIKRFPSFGGSGSHPLKVASTCPLETRFVVASKPLSLTQFAPLDIEGWNGSGFGIEWNGKKIGAVRGPFDKGSYYLLFGNNGDEYVSAMVLADAQKHQEEYIETKSTEP